MNKVLLLALVLMSIIVGSNSIRLRTNKQDRGPAKYADIDQKLKDLMKKYLTKQSLLRALYFSYIDFTIPTATILEGSIPVSQKHNLATKYQQLPPDFVNAVQNVTPEGTFIPPVIDNQSEFTIYMYLGVGYIDGSEIKFAYIQGTVVGKPLYTKTVNQAIKDDYGEILGFLPKVVPSDPRQYNDEEKKISHLGLVALLYSQFLHEVNL